MSDSIIGTLLSPGGEVSSSPFGQMKAELLALAELLEVEPLAGDDSQKPLLVMVCQKGKRFGVTEVLRRAREAVRDIPRDTGGEVLR